jgi:glucose-6-phosphate isomerase
MGLKLLFKIILMAALSIKQRIELYCILHYTSDAVVRIKWCNVIPEIYEVKEKMKNFSSEIISGNKKGYTGKPSLML